MQCEGETCKIEQPKSGEPKIVQREIEPGMVLGGGSSQTGEEGEQIRIEVLGQILLDKLKISAVNKFHRVKSDDDYAEPEYESKVDNFKINTKYLGIYFTASWCSPCQQFSPKLQEFIRRNSDTFTILAASNDTVPKQLKDYIAPKGWPHLPIEDTETLSNLQKRFGITLLPSLVIIDVATRKLITTWGREAITYNFYGCMEDWDNGNEGYLWWHFLKFW